MVNTKILDRKIRVAVVGCGRISKNHFGAIEKHSEEVELAAVCDVDADRLKEHSEKYNAPGYSCIKTMLNQKDVGLIKFCTPSCLHPDQTNQAG